MANPSVKEVLEVLRKSFKSIDFRAVIVAFGDDQGWQNAFTVIRLSAKTVAEISAEHDRLKKLYELPPELLYKRLGVEHNVEPYKGINIELSAYPVDRFERLVRRLREGIINTDNRAFRVFDSDLAIDLMQEVMYLWQNLQYEDIGDHWPVYYWGRGDQRAYFKGSPNEQGDRPLLEGRYLDKQSRGIGLPNFRGLVERIVGRSFGQSSGNAFEILFPVYARIKSVTPSFNAVNINGYFHQALGEVVVECSLFDQTQWYPVLGRSLGKNKVPPRTSGHDITTFSTGFPLKEFLESGYVQISLFKQAATRVDLHDEQSSLKSGVLSFRAFTSFVPEEDIAEYLKCLTSGTSITSCSIYRKLSPKNISNKEAKLLEYVVTYILGLCQLNPILLSNPQYDVVHGGLEPGSADIIASTQDGDPVLVSCTMAMPDARKRNMLLAAQTSIANRSGMPLEVIRVVLVTGKPSVTPSGTELLELAATDLERLWVMCQQGNLSEARQLLGLQ